MSVTAPGSPARQSQIAQAGQPADQVTQASFARAVLQSMGYPLTKQNVSSFVMWENREGGNWKNSATYNPLNTERNMPGSSSMGGGSGVQAYTSWQQGLNATIATLQEPAYGDLRAAFASGQGLTGSYKGLLTWSGNSYDTLYGASAVSQGGTNPTNNSAPSSGTGPSEWVKLLVDVGLLALGGAFAYEGAKRMISPVKSKQPGQVI